MTTAELDRWRDYLDRREGRKQESVMRWLANYLRQVLCKHQFESVEGWCEQSNAKRDKAGIRVALTCKTCGYHRSFWKF